MSEEPLPESPPTRTTRPGRKTYYSISEVAADLDVRPHVLRYWETQFPMLRPKKGRSGSRMYRERDVDVLRRIRSLLYDKGFTIKGARKRLRLERQSGSTEGQLALGIENPYSDGLLSIRGELAEILDALRRRPFR